MKTKPVAEDSEWKCLSDVMNAFIRTEVLTAACRLGLFNYLAGVPSATVEDIATRFDLDNRGVRILIMGCKQAGLLAEKVHGSYTNSQVAARFLTSGSAESVLNFVCFVRDVQQKTCRTLFDSLRRREPAGLIELGGRDGETLYDLNAGRSSSETDFHTAMSEYSRMIAPTPPPELARCQHLMDVGGGMGDFAHRLCLAYPHLTCTVLELPTVSARVAERVAKGEISPHIRAAAADAFTDNWPSGADALVFSHFVEIFEPGAVQILYARASAYLPPDGKVFIWTLTAPLRGEISLQAVKSSVYFLTTAGGNGMTYSPEEHQSWLNAAGLAVDRLETQVSTSHSLIIATKRAR